MKNNSTTKQPLEDSKGTKNVYGYQLTDIQIMVFNKWCNAQSISMNTLQSEQRKEVVGMWLRNTGQKEVPTPTKEGLHTQGEELELVCKEYNGIYTIRKTSFDPNGLDVAEITTNHPVEKQKELGELIVKAVNERKALLDSHRELVSIIDDLLQWGKLKDGKFTLTGNEIRYNEIKTAINNAKNIKQ